MGSIELNQRLEIIMKREVRNEDNKFECPNISDEDNNYWNSFQLDSDDEFMEDNEDNDILPFFDDPDKNPSIFPPDTTNGFSEFFNSASEDDNEFSVVERAAILLSRKSQLSEKSLERETGNNNYDNETECSSENFKHNQESMQYQDCEFVSSPLKRKKHFHNDAKSSEMLDNIFFLESSDNNSADVNFYEFDDSHWIDEDLGAMLLEKIIRKREFINIEKHNSSIHSITSFDNDVDEKEILHGEMDLNSEPLDIMKRYDAIKMRELQSNEEMDEKQMIHSISISEVYERAAIIHSRS